MRRNRYRCYGKSQRKTLLYVLFPEFGFYRPELPRWVRNSGFITRGVYNEAWFYMPNNQVVCPLVTSTTAIF